MRNQVLARAGHAALFLFTMAALAPLASATALGHLDLANCVGGGVTVTATTIDWLPGGGGSGCVQTGTGTSVSYTGGGPLGVGVTGSILDLSVATIFPVLDFLTFVGNPNLHFDLYTLGPGVPNTVCTNTFNPGAPVCSVFAGSPFLLQPTSTGTSVTLSATGFTRDSSVWTSNWIGAFTTQISGATPSAIQSIILAGGSITSTESGDFTLTAVVPEPATTGMAMAGGLLIAISALRRRFRR